MTWYPAPARVPACLPTDGHKHRSVHIVLRTPFIVGKRLTFIGTCSCGATQEVGEKHGVYQYGPWRHNNRPLGGSGSKT